MSHFHSFNAVALRSVDSMRFSNAKYKEEKKKNARDIFLWRLKKCMQYKVSETECKRIQQIQNDYASI